MAVTVAQLLARVGAEASETAEASRILLLTEQMVGDYITEHTPDPDTPLVIPPVVLDEAVFRCAVDLWNKTQAPNGVLMTTFDDGGDGSAVALRVSSDPLHAARVFLAPYVPPLGFA
ncbi:hypothetical protein [Occultella gossypii]|uniref:Phage gp6-like head-tail connector protein n=1 Tax=Occultella gossypii TaxID=2800820 RepID=A0ABS7SA92_9MICO|nr:hypothetical protein [Occultella gossypii]MBZ2197271.1 hypothetical protein [Occultella gossypii]